MAVFAYTALDRSGRQTTGTIPADSKAAAMDQVISQGLSPVSITESKNGAAVAASTGGSRPPSTRVPSAAVETFTRELANLLGGRQTVLPESRHMVMMDEPQAITDAVWRALGAVGRPR